jgi:tRNA A-37 threonylcarbamoyl transferase component Bud32
VVWQATPYSPLQFSAATLGHVSAKELEQALRDLPAHGRLLKARPSRQVWRFEWAGKPYILKFYPRAHNPLKRLIRGSPAWREFVRLKLLQKRRIPAPRVVSHLSGYRINGVKGDAVILESIEPAVQLDCYLNDHLLHGERVPDRYELGQKVLDLVHDLGHAKLGHSDLHLGNLLLKDDKIYLLDGYSVHTGGLTMRDVQLLAHSVSRSATRTELLRGWNVLRGGIDMPRKNPVRKRQWRKFLQSAVRKNDYFGKFARRGWSGFFYKHNKFPRRWAPISRHDVGQEDWEREWSNLLARIENDQLELLKRSRSGDVLAGEVVLGGRPVEIVIKRPRRSKLHRYITEIGRGTRVRRAWKKAWALVVRDIPTAWPLVVMERRILGYPVDGIIVFERVAGMQLADVDLDALAPRARQDLFRRLGRNLRRLERSGLSQYDSKFTNWVIIDDAKLGPTPVIVDVDGIRRVVPSMWPIDRLLRSMREHPQYTPEDSKELCLGYAPFARLTREPVAPEPPAETMDDASDA